MLRRGFLVLSLLALVLIAASPVLAEPKGPKDAAKSASAGPKGKALGKIKAISGSNWEVEDETQGSKTVDVSGAQVKWPGRKNATLADFKVGDRVGIKLQGAGPGNTAQASGTPQARMVHLIPGQTFTHFTGRVTGVSGDAVTVENAQGETKTFTLGGATAVKPKKKTTGDIATDSQVTVVSRAAENAALAIHIGGGDD